MADEPLHPQQSSAQGNHDNRHIRPASQTDVKEADDDETHHDDKSSTGLQFSVNFDIDSLAQEQGDGGSVVSAKVTFEVHVGPFGGAASPCILLFQAFVFGVLGRMKNEFTVRKAVAPDSETLIGELDLLFLVGILPDDFPAHFLQFGAVKLNQEPR